MVKQISDNEIYLLIKYIKSVLWRIAKCLSYIEEARCLKVNTLSSWHTEKTNHCIMTPTHRSFSDLGSPRAISSYVSSPDHAACHLGWYNVQLQLLKYFKYCSLGDKIFQFSL